MVSPNMLDASKLSDKSKVLKGEKAKEALNKVSEKKSKKRSQAEKRKAMYGDQDVKK